MYVLQQSDCGNVWFVCVGGGVASKKDFSVVLLLGRKVQGCSPSPSKKKKSPLHENIGELYGNIVFTDTLLIIGPSNQLSSKWRTLPLAK